MICKVYVYINARKAEQVYMVIPWGFYLEKMRLILRPVESKAK